LWPCRPGPRGACAREGLPSIFRLRCQRFFSFFWIFISRDFVIFAPTLIPYNPVQFPYVLLFFLFRCVYFQWNLISLCVDSSSFPATTRLPGLSGDVSTALFPEGLVFFFFPPKRLLRSQSGYSSFCESRLPPPPRVPPLIESIFTVADQHAAEGSFFAMLRPHVSLSFDRSVFWTSPYRLVKTSSFRFGPGFCMVLPPPGIFFLSCIPPLFVLSVPFCTTPPPTS